MKESYLKWIKTQDTFYRRDVEIEFQQLIIYEYIYINIIYA